MMLYIHIPFCKRKCNYCDFLSGCYDKNKQNSYMEALYCEIGSKASVYNKQKIESIFIGGGTPSLLDEKYIVELMRVVKSNYDLEENCEITIEVNPGTTSLEKFYAYKNAGINRLSIGLQSANDEELKAIGRIHNFQDFCEAYEEAKKAGFSNINVDLMSALPGQNLEKYIKNLESIFSVAPDIKHVSAYSLIIEEGTPFYELYEKGQLELPDEDTDRLMYEKTEEFLLEKGFTRYEISNYALPGFECQHNLGYWQGREYIGFGIGAASFWNNARFKNGDDIDRYIENPLDYICDRQTLSLNNQMEEFMFLGLRVTAGVKNSDFVKRFGKNIMDVYEETVDRHVKDGLLRQIKTNDDVIYAFTHKGLDVSNYCLADFLL